MIGLDKWVVGVYRNVTVCAEGSKRGDTHGCESRRTRSSEWRACRTSAQSQALAALLFLSSTDEDAAFREIDGFPGSGAVLTCENSD